MREQGLLLGNYSLFWLTTLLLLGFQSTLWLQVLGYFPSPHLWIPVLSFWVIYRNPKEGLIMTYIVALTASPLTGMPIGVLLMVLILLFGFLFILRQRIFWTGPTYFMMICGLYSTLLPAIYFVCSWVMEAIPSQHFLFFDWLIRALMTALFALPLYFLFTWFDMLTHKSQPKDTGSQFI